MFCCLDPSNDPSFSEKTEGNNFPGKVFPFESMALKDEMQSVLVASEHIPKTDL